MHTEQKQLKQQAIRRVGQQQAEQERIKAMAPQPVWKLELNEADVKAAIAAWVSTTYRVQAEPKDVTFDIRQAYHDSRDQRENTHAGINKATITLAGGGAPGNGQPVMRGPTDRGV